MLYVTTIQVNAMWPTEKQGKGMTQAFFIHTH